MKKWQVMTSLAIAVIAVLSLATSAFAQVPEALLTTNTTLDVQTREALVAALDDEYKARAFYQAVIDQFGPVAPFANIVRSEATHIAALKSLFAAYALPVPPDPYAGNVQAPATLKEAALAGVQAEKDNVAMYNRFLQFVEEPDIVRVFSQLKNASLYQHLPAFQRYAGSTSTSSLYLGPRWSR